MPKASSISVGSNVSLLFKGSPGFGKTLAAASFALLGPVKMHYFDKQSPVELITFFTKKRFGDLAEQILDNITYEIYGAHNANEYLNSMIDLATDCRYIAVITDSVTVMTSAAVNWHLNFGRDLKKRANSSKVAIPDWDEYKTETSLVSQALDLGRKLPAYVIWTAHPLPQTKIEGAGSSIKVTKSNSIVTYGSKAAGLIPGQFTEIYHFSQNSIYSEGATRKQYMVNVEAVGDEFAKSPLLADYIKEFDITDRLFVQVWKELLDKSRESSNVSAT